MSLNAGLVTFVNYGSDVSRATSIITFAHELGHNMGSTVRLAAAATYVFYKRLLSILELTVQHGLFIYALKFLWLPYDVTVLKHDEDGTDCAPGGSAGNYIMYAHATDGGKPNNNQFSPCSIEMMHTIMEVDARDADNGCFQGA